MTETINSFVFVQALFSCLENWSLIFNEAYRNSSVKPIAHPHLAHLSCKSAVASFLRLISITLFYGKFNDFDFHFSLHEKQSKVVVNA